MREEQESERKIRRRLSAIRDQGKERERERGKKREEEGRGWRGGPRSLNSNDRRFASFPCYNGSGSSRFASGASSLEAAASTSSSVSL